MTGIMDWGLCREKFIRSAEADTEKVASIVEAAKSRIKHIKSIAASKDNVSFVVEGYYEAIKELLVALLLSKDLRSKNHQCLISYFYKNYPDYEAEAHLISQMSYLRNRLDYYGEQIDFGFYEKNKADFDNIIDLLTDLIEKNK